MTGCDAESISTPTGDLRPDTEVEHDVLSVAPTADQRTCDGALGSRDRRRGAVLSVERLVALSRDHRARFALVGLGITGVHFLVLAALLPVVVPEVANALAFVVATQVNFAVSYSWTWASRRGPGREGPRQLARRLGLFNASALVAFAVNAAAFAGAHRLLDTPPLVSAVVATVLSAVVSFVVSSRLVFARRTLAPAPGPVVQLPAGHGPVLELPVDAPASRAPTSRSA